MTPVFAAALKDRELRIVITGANGWLGHTTLAMLEEVFGDGVGARVSLFGSRAREIETPGGRLIACKPLSEMGDLPAAPTLLLHFAFETKDRVAGYSLNDFVARNAAIDDMVLASADRFSPIGVFVPSSGAVYGPDKALERNLEANPYGYMKVCQEERWATWVSRRTCTLVCTRVFNLAGPYINKFDTYALASILLNLLRDEPIMLRADKPIIRSYVYTRDLMRLVLALMLDPGARSLAPFDTVGAEEIEIGDLAKRAAAVIGRPDHPVERPPIVAGPVNRYVGEGSVWGELLVHYGISPTPLDVQIVNTAAYMKAAGITRPPSHSSHTNLL